MPRTASRWLPAGPGGTRHPLSPRQTISTQEDEERRLTRRSIQTASSVACTTDEAIVPIERVRPFPNQAQVYRREDS